jgi:hypothetical protein
MNAKKRIWIAIALAVVALLTIKEVQLQGADKLEQEKNDAAQAIMNTRYRNVTAPPPSAEARAQYAKIIDQKFIEAGIESYTRATGDDNTILEVRDVLAGRVRAHQVANVMDYSHLRSLGFKSVAYTNGELNDSNFYEHWEVPQ